MKLSIIGSGYVGLVSGACFAQMSNKVTCVDIDTTKIDNLKKGIMPIYEPGLESMVRENYKNKSLMFSLDLQKSISNAQIVFIAVGTPMGDDGSADLQYVLSVAKSIGQFLETYTVIVDKSTVPVGTADKVKAVIQDELNKRNKDIKFDVVSNPEFLKEGAAIDDFMYPDRVVVGADSDKALNIMHELYAPFMKNRDRFISMDVRSAEMTKYAANAMLATKISFINEISNICELVGADVNKVRNGIGSDARIGYSFIYPGCGYGGSCFPKDVQALAKTSKDHGYTPQLLEAVETVNKQQKHVLANKVIKQFGEDLNGCIFAMWGLAFKPGTDDMREASAITIINELTKRGAKIQAYDPKARLEAETHYLKGNIMVSYVDEKYQALEHADALILVTEWLEFRSPDFDKIKQKLKSNLFFDGRNQFDKIRMEKLGFKYFQIGVKD
ncbi:MAG: UDP-glucose/GDP-mannose dehydrogenase family protein [Alcanivoracaceae bacterium]|nr:UDP-glucose/GDP-mannose dehydrogenase family protein [Alcanivoracaceae bacterium]